MDALGPPMPVEQTETFSPSSGVLAVLRDLDGIIEQRGDGRAAARVTGQDHIAAHLALCAVDMILTFKLMHKKHLTK